MRSKVDEHEEIEAVDIQDFVKNERIDPAQFYKPTYGPIVNKALSLLLLKDSRSDTSLLLTKTFEVPPT